MTDMGTRLARLRAREGLTQTEAATRLDIRQPSLADIENGKTKTLRGNTVAMMCRLYRTTAEYICFGTSEAEGEEWAEVEAELLHMVRSMSPDRRRAALDSLRGLFDGQPATVAKASTTDSPRARLAGKLPQNLDKPIQESFDESARSQKVRKG